MQGFTKNIFLKDIYGLNWMEIDVLIDINSNIENTNIFQEGFRKYSTLVPQI